MRGVRARARLPLVCVALGGILTLAGCGTIPQSAELTGGASSAAAETQGYILLYRFVQDERRLDQIFLIQDANEKVEKLITGIAERSDKAFDAMPGLAKLSPPVNLDATAGMPEVETKTREAIAATLPKDR